MQFLSGVLVHENTSNLISEEGFDTRRFNKGHSLKPFIFKGSVKLVTKLSFCVLGCPLDFVRGNTGEDRTLLPPSFSTFFEKSPLSERPENDVC